MTLNFFLTFLFAWHVYTNKENSIKVTHYYYYVKVRLWLTSSTIYCMKLSTQMFNVYMVKIVIASYYYIIPLISVTDAYFQVLLCYTIAFQFHLLGISFHLMATVFFASEVHFSETINKCIQILNPIFQFLYCDCVVKTTNIHI